jgi:GR25 family glycosyltransferase involved in LPS biosynthesis
MKFSFNETNTFCISLLSNKERMERMAGRFNKLDMNVSIFPATCPDEIDNIYDTLFAPHLSVGQRCCAYSHYRLWKHLLEDDANDYMLIIEDDARFDFQWKDKLEELSLWDTDAENIHAIFLNASEPIEPAFDWTRVKEQYLTGAYILTKSGAEILLRNFEMCLFSSDWMTSRLQCYQNCYSYFPWLVIQEGIDSTIGSGVELDHAKVVSCLRDIEYSMDNYC